MEGFLDSVDALDSRQFVLAVKRLTREGIERRFVPATNDRLEPGDVLIVLGTDEAIARLKSAGG